MDPISLTAEASTIGTIGAGASAGGSVLGAIGNLISGNASKQMYQYQAGVAELNKRIALQDADYARATGESEAQKSGMQTRFELGKIRAAQSGSGIDIASGSHLAMQQSQQEIGTHDQAVIRSNAAKRAYGYEVEAATDTAQGQVYRAAGRNAMTAGMIGAGTSILGGVSSVSSKWLDAKRVGLYEDSGFYGGSPETNPRLRPI